MMFTKRGFNPDESLQGALDQTQASDKSLDTSNPASDAADKSADNSIPAAEQENADEATAQSMVAYDKEA